MIGSSTGARLVVVLALPLACAPPLDAPQPPPEPEAPPPAPVPAEPPSASALPVAAAPEPCASDGDCGYDPVRGRCEADPRANRQPLLVDQGIVCYCEGAACGTLRVQPVPCESDASCAVRADPRPHPVAASAAYRHEQGRPCRDFTISTTCERTNICTLHRLRCPRR